MTKKVRLDQLPEWPPEPGGAFDRDDVLQARASEVVVTNVLSTRQNHIQFAARIGGRERTYEFLADTAFIARQIEQIIREHSGRTLQELGAVMIEIEDERNGHGAEAFRRPRMTRVLIDGFKTICDLDLVLTGRNILIGANGSGKSNLISFFSMLNAASNDRLQEFVLAHGRASSLLHDGPNRTPGMRGALRFETARGANDYEFRLAWASPDTLMFTEEKFQFSPAGQRPHPWKHLPPGRLESGLGEFAESDEPAAQTTGLVRGVLRRCAVYHFHDTSATGPLRQTSDERDNFLLRADGGNIAAFLARLQREQEQAYRRIRDAVRAIAPFFDDFIFEPERGRLLLQWRERSSDVIFGAHQASDGTLRAMALAALLLQPEDRLPGLLLLDEPELGLNPAAITLVAGLLRSVSAHSQILVATQSPLILNEFDPEDILVVDRDGAGGETKRQRCSSIRRLDAGELGAWLEAYSLGELWQKNVIGGRPA